MPLIISSMVEPGSIQENFIEYCELFISSLEEAGRSKLTLKNYRSDLKAFGEWLDTSDLKLLSLSTLSDKEMKLYQEALLNDPKLQINSVRRRLGTLRKFYTWLQQTGIAPPVPLPKLPSSIQENPNVKETFISHAEQLMLLKVVEQEENPRDVAIIKLIVYAGLRVGELCNLRWIDIELSQSRLTVRSASGKHSRTVAVPKEICQALIDLGYQAKANSQEPVFVGQRGGMTSRGIQDVVKKYAKQTGLRNITPHMLRHAYATRLLEQGVRLGDIATLMGASAKTVLNYEKSLPE